MFRKMLKYLLNGSEVKDMEELKEDKNPSKIELSKEKQLEKINSVQTTRDELVEKLLNKYISTEEVDDPTKREYDVPFRRSDSLDYQLYFNRKSPKGTPKKMIEFCNIAGVSYREENAIKAVLGDDLTLRIEKESDNPFGENGRAIKILADYNQDNEFHTTHIGYIPNDKVTKVYNAEIVNITLRAIYLPSKERSIGFRIDIWEPREKTVKVVKEEEYDKTLSIPDNFADRNHLARDLEREGFLDNAIEIYLKNIEDLSDTSLYPFKRLAIIYRKQKRYEDELLIVQRSLEYLRSKEINHPKDQKQIEEMEKRLKTVESKLVK